MNIYIYFFLMFQTSMTYLLYIYHFIAHIKVVIGGGHNNCLPIIRGASASAAAPLSVSNLDPHGDIRNTHEGMY
jgi:arginase family enzyme